MKQHADLVLGIYREEMYRPGGGMEGATELIIAKNRNGPTGFVDLYFYQRWLRFEDMLDPERCLLADGESDQDVLVESRAASAALVESDLMTAPLSVSLEPPSALSLRMVTQSGGPLRSA